MWWRRSSVGWGVVASLALHGAWIGSLDGSARAGGPIEAPRRAAYQLPVEVRFGRSATGPRVPVASLVPLGGPQRASALDMDALEGTGGTGASDQRSMLLFSFVSSVALQDTDLNNLAQNQTQRIRTSATRATQEERRATPNADEDVFLASGREGHAERRRPAARDAPAGASLARRDRTQLPHASKTATEAQPSEARGAVKGPPEVEAAALASAPSLARGIARGRGLRASSAARVAFARPNVDPGPAATPAERLDPHIRDNRDAELLAAALQRSIVDASAQRARHKAEGEGGAGLGPGFGLSGDRTGARALPYAPGSGHDGALDTRDARYVRWFVEQKRRVQSELTFPKPRALTKDQGISIYRVVVRRDGGLAQGPHLVRSSGFADFDEAAVVAIRRAAPFSPLPTQLLPDASDLTLLIPVAFSNPMVQ